MLYTQQDVERFRAFRSAGGLREVENLTKGKALLELAKYLQDKLLGCISEEITNYNEATELVATIEKVENSVGLAVAGLSLWNSYLSVATEPTDLEQVSIGVNVIRKLDGTDQDAPAPSILPITSKTELSALNFALNEIVDEVDSVSILMNKVNTELAPADGGAGGGIAPPAPNLSPSTVQEVIAMNVTLSAITGTLQIPVSVIVGMANSAAVERNRALEMFNSAIIFTISSNQTKKPSISDAANEMFPNI